MAILTISRQFGAGGLTIGKASAKRLNYHFISSRVINEMAKEANVSVKWIKSVEKDAGDWIMRMTSKLVTSDFVSRHIGDSRSDFDEKKYISFLEAIIRRIAEEDNMVFLGRGSQFILQKNPNAIHVLIVADLNERVKFIENLWNVSAQEALKAIKTREKRRDTFLKYFNQGHPNSLSLYQLIINTSKMSMEQAEDLVVWLVKDFEKRIKKG
ncbi:MAG: cytidylate kinase-like family protein [Deltaproteobacteria bacterium]|nr:cytidylate kinase-like family protein [Deltaproteobacteria bacterium]